MPSQSRFVPTVGAKPTWRMRWSGACAGLVHDLHRWMIPGTTRVILPLNVRVIESHLREVHEAFARAGAGFWLRDATALGAYRDGGVIPDDVDIDLGMWAAEAGRLDAVLADLAGRGFVIYSRKEHRVRLWKDLETVELSISGLHPPPDEYTRVVESFFSRPEPVQLLGRTFLVPGPAELYLEFCYGPDWRVRRPRSWWASSCWRPAEQRENHAREFAARLGL